MKYSRCDWKDLEKALEIVNLKYEGNIEFNQESDPSKKNFRLHCKELSGKGHRLHISYDDPFGVCKQKTKRSRNACWHVHGDFFDALFSVNPNAVIRTNGQKITANEGNWQDRNIGSQIFPIYFSESCECN